MSTVQDSTRRLIIRCAEELFAEKGFDATGISELGKKAGVAKSLFYHYFRSKEEILDLIYRDFFEEATKLRESFMANFRTQTPATGHNFTRAYLTFLKSKQNVIRIVMKENLKADRRFSILPFFQADFQRGEESARLGGFPFPDRDNLLIASFFFAFLPTLSFTLFHEEFANFFGLEVQNLTDKYIQFFETTYVGLMRNFGRPPTA